nr:hypothetical protein [Lachnospiraceae bacterium]
DRKRLDSCDKAVNKVKPLYITYQEQAKNVKELERDIEGKRKDLVATQATLKKAEEDFQKSKEQEPLITEYSTTLTEIRNNEESYRKRDQIRKDVDRHKSQLTAAEEKVEKLKREQEEKKARLEKLQGEELKLKDSGELFVKAENRLQTFEKLKTRAGEALSEADKLIASQKTLSGKQVLAKKTIEELDAAVRERIHYERILDGCRAGILAGMLEEGMPCPVCGSLEHPAPAVLPEESITEEGLQSYKDKEESARKIKDKTVTEAEKLNASFTAKADTLRVSILDLVEDPALDREERPTEDLEYNHTLLMTLCRDIGEAQKQAESERKIQQKRKRDLEKIEAELSDIRNKILPQLEDSWGKAVKEVENMRIQVKEDETTLNTLSNLKYDSWALAQGEISRLEETIQRIRKDIDSAQRKAQDCQKKQAEISSSISTQEGSLESNREKYREKELAFTVERDRYFDSNEDFLSFLTTDEEMEQLNQKISTYILNLERTKSLLSEARRKVEGKEVIDIGKEKEKEAVLDREFKEASNRLNVIENRIRMNEDIKDRIQLQSGEYEKVYKENQIHRRLYNLVSGNIPNGSLKITLEQYVQTAGFDGIIAAANKRLLPMSDGQFELVRKMNLDSKQSKEILDLEVLDNFTGTYRPVGNLSGGESFKASLSLALGLSDTISQNSGGIQMDALFVDEGFGTLDKKSIDGAMEVLMGLSGKGKLVGIISHREELIESIPCQIHITKTKKGSEFTIEKGI